MAKLGSTVEQTTQKTTKKCVKAQFTTSWILAIVVEVGEPFHHDFQASLQTNLRK